MIWKEIPDINSLNRRGGENMPSFLGIEFTEAGDDFISARMPVNERTIQPFGILHGGASVVLAETLGSIGSFLIVDNEKFNVVGLDVNANHLRPVSKGYVTGICKAISVGRKIHVWEIKIFDDNSKMTCISRLTVAVVEKDHIRQ